MPITIQDIRREVKTAISRVRIIDSDTVHVADGDHPMQPSVTTASGGVGDVVGPSVAQHEEIVVFNGTTGKLIKKSAAVIEDFGSFLIFKPLSSAADLLIVAAENNIGGDGGKMSVDGGAGAVNGDGGDVVITSGRLAGSGDDGDITLDSVGGTIRLDGPVVFITGRGTTGGSGSGTGFSSQLPTEFDIEVQGSIVGHFIATGLDLLGLDLIGLAPKESHIDLLALATEHAFS